MKLFNFNKKKVTPEKDLSEESEINLFQDDLSSPEFLAKVKAMKNINKKFQKGMNLLHFACEYNAISLAKQLIDLKINIEEKNIYGNTPLWTAVFNARENYNLIDLLLLHKANPNSINDAKKTPLDFAVTIGDQILIKKLKNSSAKL